MRTFAALFCLALFLALTSLASAAPADRVDLTRVTQSREAVVDYWTVERMEKAVPVDRARGNGFGRGKPAAIPFESYEYPGSYTVYPATTHGKVFFTLRGTNYVCSGTALNSSNRSVVWTAGHCLNEGPGAFATNWAFVPAYRDGSRPFGTWTARTLMTTSAWGNQGDISYDLGAAVVSTSGGTALTDAVGGRNVAFNYDRNQFYTSFGYPAAPPFTGGRLWLCESQLGASDPTTSPQTMGIGCDMTGGSSGGGWIVGGSVYSVNSYGYSNQRNVMYGPYHGSVAQGLYNQASTG
ncbi:MAG: trypsin-like serine peptidase [Thermoleophilaceae bacterium]